MPITPDKCIEAHLAKTFHRFGHLTLKRQPPHLTVGDDIESNFLLERQYFVNGFIFNGFELGDRKAPRSK